MREKKTLQAHTMKGLYVENKHSKKKPMFVLFKVHLPLYMIPKGRTSFSHNKQVIKSKYAHVAVYIHINKKSVISHQKTTHYLDSSKSGKISKQLKKALTGPEETIGNQ